MPEVSPAKWEPLPIPCLGLIQTGTGGGTAESAEYTLVVTADSSPALHSPRIPPNSRLTSSLGPRHHIVLFVIFFLQKRL